MISIHVLQQSFSFSIFGPLAFLQGDNFDDEDERMSEHSAFSRELASREDVPGTGWSSDEEDFL